MFYHLHKYTKHLFRICWDNCDRYQAFMLAKQINPQLTNVQLEKSWQFLTIFNENFKVACLEYEMMLNGLG